MLLDALPDDDFALFIGDTTAPSMYEHGDVLQRPNAQVENVHFPTSGVMSVIALLEGGSRPVEAVTVGREGMTNVHAVLGSRRTGAESTVAQVEGKGFTVPVEQFGEHASRPGPLQRIVHGYAQAYRAQTAYGAACNAVHYVTRRCARWLLQTHDRVVSDSFYLTQEYLATMLGVERSTVSVAAADLHRNGLIDYRRGHVRILDREGLEAASCECYENIRTEYSRLVPLA